MFVVGVSVAALMMRLVIRHTFRMAMSSVLMEEYDANEVDNKPANRSENEAGLVQLRRFRDAFERFCKHEDGNENEKDGVNEP